MLEEGDNVVCSSVDFEVALQSHPGRTESSTAGTLELRCCCCGGCCSVVLFMASGKALASLSFTL